MIMRSQAYRQLLMAFAVPLGLGLLMALALILLLAVYGRADDTVHIKSRLMPTTTTLPTKKGPKPHVLTPQENMNLILQAYDARIQSLEHLVCLKFYDSLSPETREAMQCAAAMQRPSAAYGGFGEPDSICLRGTRDHCSYWMSSDLYYRLPASERSRLR